MAGVLGQAQGQGVTNTNQALSAYTNGDHGTGIPGYVQNPGVQFKTNTNNIPVVAGHYYAASAWYAAINCGVSPIEQFALVNVGGSSTPFNLGPSINVCTAPGSQTYSSAAGTVTAVNIISTVFQMPAGTSNIGLQLSNLNQNTMAQGAGYGNDGAFDLPTLVDVTPQLDKSFSPTLIAPGQTSTVTVTITNTTDLQAKTDWSLTDTLPAGVVVAPTPAVGGTCAQVTGAAFVRTAVAGTGVFSATGGDLAAGQTSCTITFTVTAAADGTYTNGPGNIVTNLNPPANAVLVVRAPRITLTKALGAPREAATDQFTVALRTGGAAGTVVNSTANSTTAGSGSTVTAGSGTTGAYVATVGTAYTLTEAGAGSTSLANYTATITCTDSFGLQTGLPVGVAYNPAAPPTITPVIGANISCVLTNTAQPIISYSKTVDKGANTIVNPGDTLTYTLSIVNSGSVPSGTISPFDDLMNVVNNATFTAGSITIAPAGTGTASYSAVTRRLTWTGIVPANTTVNVTYTVTVNAGAFGQLQNAFMGVSVVNPIGASLQWRKIDATAAKNVLAGASWTLTALNGLGQPTGTPIVITDCVSSPCAGVDTNPAGGLFFVKGLTPGNYQLVETKAPVGYVLNSTPIPVTVSATTQTTVLADVVNQQAAPIVLPLTGGLGTDVIAYWAISLLGAAAVLLGWQLRRRTRIRRSP